MITGFPKHIYDIRSDFGQFAGQWLLDEPRAANGDEIDAREFTNGKTYLGPLPIKVPIYKSGQEVAFHLAAFEMPVVTWEVAEIVREIAANDLELFPIEVPGAQGAYQIMNATCLLDCLDESRSNFTRWQPGDHRSDLIGQYRMISTIRIDPTCTGEHHIFRIRTWPIALLVSNTIKDALAAIPNLGVRFEPAS